MLKYWIEAQNNPLHPQLEGLLSSLDEHVIEAELILSDNGSTVFVPRVRHHVEVWCPHFKLPLPVDDGGKWGADKEWALGVALERRRVENEYGI